MVPPPPTLAIGVKFPRFISLNYMIFNNKKRLRYVWREFGFSLIGGLILADLVEVEGVPGGGHGTFLVQVTAVSDKNQP